MKDGTNTLKQDSLPLTRRKGDQEMKNEYIAWKANEDTGTVYYKFADNPEVLLHTCHPGR